MVQSGEGNNHNRILGVRTQKDRQVRPPSWAEDYVAFAGIKQKQSSNLKMIEDKVEVLLEKEEYHSPLAKFTMAQLLINA